MTQQTQTKQLPKGWKKEPLKEVLETLESGGRPKGGAQKEGIPSIGGEHLNYNGMFNFEKMKFIPKSYFNLMTKGIIKKEDVLIVKDGATTGKTSFVDNNFPYEKSAVNEHVFIARANKKIFPKYLFYFLYSIEGQDQLKKAITGSAQGGINLSILDKIYIKYPQSSQTQSLIVSAIETHFSRLDNAIKNLKSVKEKIQLYRKAVLKKAFENRGTKKEIKELFEITKGKKVKIIKEKTKNSVPYLLIDTLRGKEPEFFTEDKNYTEAIPEDILMVFDGANSGLVGTGLRGAVGSTIGRLRPKEEVNKNYLCYFLKLNFQILNKDIKGSAIPHVKPTKLRSLKISLPQLSEQQQIVQEIESKFSVIDKVEEAVDNSLKKAEMLKKAILKAAFEGRLVKESEVGE